METGTAHIKAILTADSSGSFVTRRIESVRLEFGGIPGDRHFGTTSKADARQPMYPRGTEIWNRRQITIVSEEECTQIANELGIDQILPEWLGANLAVSGFPALTRLPMGSRILFPNGTGLICMGENQPCIFPGKEIQRHYRDKPGLDKKFVRAGQKLRGIVCAVECPGEIFETDEIRILINDFDNPMQ